MSIPPPTQEQNDALNYAIGGANIIIDSVAGAGKTTFTLQLASRVPQKQIILITFSRKLKDETQIRAIANNLANLRAFTYHGFICAAAHACCYTDNQIMSILAANTELTIAKHDILVVDEMQDATEIYMRVIDKIIAHSPQVCLIGDKFQSIYRFRGSDARYMHFAPQIWNREFSRFSFQLTQRCTIQTAQFINSLIGYERIKSARNGPLVDYYEFRPFDKKSRVKLIKSTIERYGATNVLLLLPSTRGKLCGELISQISASGTNVYKADDDYAEVDSHLMDGKFCALTYHVAKGLERNCVIVEMFSRTYFKYFARDEKPHKLCNAQYVALTRAKEHLIVIQNKDECLPFATSAIYLCHYHPSRGVSTQIDASNEEQPITVTQLVRFVRPEIEERIFREWLHFTKVSMKPEEEITFNSTSQARDGLIESVADITGTFVTVSFMHSLMGAQEWTNALNTEADDTYSPKRLARRFRINCDFKTANDLQIAALFHASTAHDTHKLTQIEKWDWMSPEMQQSLLARLRNILRRDQPSKGKPQFEVSVATTVDGRRPLIGRYDYMWVSPDREILYEIKCCAKTEPAHLLQLACYAYLLGASPIHREYKLINVRTNELFTLGSSREDLANIVQFLMRERQNEPPDDDEFLARIKHIIAAPPPSMPSLDMSSSARLPIVAIDTETTGFAPTDKITEIAAVAFDAAGVIIGAWSRVIGPIAPIAAALREFYAILQRTDKLIGFNLMFDIRFIYREAADFTEIPLLINKLPLCDVRNLYRPEFGTGGLAKASLHLGVIPRGPMHHAEIDAQVTGDCYFALLMRKK